jgi:hypothetical protein
MIWFECKKCKKVLGRADNSAGAMVFCDCGQSVTVPWESTVAEPERAPIPDAPAAPRLEPLQFEPWRSTAPPSSPPASMPAMPARYDVGLPPPLAPMPTRGVPRAVDPNFCLNHDAVPRANTCADCGMSFCADCICPFDGAMLCGPCKNYRAKVLQLPAKAGPLALWCLATALLAAPLVFLLFSFSQKWGSTVFVLIALVPQVLAFVLGLFALHRRATSRQTLDGSLAVTGMATAVVLFLFGLVLALHGSKLYVAGPS